MNSGPPGDAAWQIGEVSDAAASEAGTELGTTATPTSAAHAASQSLALRRSRDATNGSWFVLRIAPYVGSEQRTSGAVLTLQNVTAFRASLEQAIYEREYTKAIINTAIDAIVND
jgi:hypothetical protein